MRSDTAARRGFANVLAGLYAFLQGAWPLGLLEIVFTIVALRR
jgi:hypothetical protein